MKKLSILFGLFFLVSLGYSQLQWQPQNSGTNSYLTDVHFTDQFNGWVSGVQGLILHTTDGGANWYEQDPPPNNVYYTVCFSDNQHGWAAGFGGKIIGTSDGGTNWTQQSSGTTTDLFDACFVDQNQGWIVGGDNGTFPNYDPYRVILHTSNGGSNWSKQVDQNDEYLLRAVHFSDQTNGWAVGESGTILHTSDGGGNWNQQMADNSYHFYGVHSVNSMKGWVVGTYLGLPHVAVIFNTIDGGVTWESQDFGTDESFSDIFFTDENHGWVVGGTSGQANITYTTDGGINWITDYPTVNTGLTAVHFIDNSTGWSVGNLGTIITTSTTTDVDDQVNNSDIEIYPNPASNYLTIELPGQTQSSTSIKIYTSIGKLVFSASIPANSTNGSRNINTSNFSEGLYTLAIQDENGRNTEKLIIQR